jgi:Tol biopolymer transport system component
MHDLRSRLAVLVSDVAPAPDALDATKRRAASRRRRRQTATISLAMLVAVAGVVVAVRAFDVSGRTPAGGEPTGTIVFVRSESREVLFGHDTYVHAQPRVMSLRLSDGLTTGLTDGRTQVKFPVISSDGSRVALSVGRLVGDAARWQTYTMNADGSDMTRVFGCPGRGFCQSFPVAWSPDGRRIAVYSDVGGRPALWVVSVETGSKRRLTWTGGYFGGASWSPDAATIAISGGRFGSPGITLVNSWTGRIERRVTPAGVQLVSGLSWSPRSGAIAFSGRTAEQSSSIFVIGLAGESIRHVTSCDGCEDSSPSWSPDGRFIAFARGGYRSADVYVVRADGTGLRRLTSGAAVDCCVSWTSATSLTGPSPTSALTRGSIDIGLARQVCNVQSMSGDVNGDATSDVAWTGTMVTSDGRCPSSPSWNRFLAIDVNGDGQVDVSSTQMDCETWCGLYALADLDGDGVDEILVNEGHLWAPASAVVGVYELVLTELVPIRFPDPPGHLRQTGIAAPNQFPLFDSWQGYDGAYCDGSSFVTWEGLPTRDGGSVRAVITTTYALNARTWTFDEISAETRPGPHIPDRTGWHTLCGSTTNGIG